MGRYCDRLGMARAELIRNAVREHLVRAQTREEVSRELHDKEIRELYERTTRLERIVRRLVYRVGL